jgi:hypothetical protein
MHALIGLWPNSTLLPWHIALECVPVRVRKIAMNP